MDDKGREELLANQRQLEVEARELDTRDVATYMMIAGGLSDRPISFKGTRKYLPDVVVVRMNLDMRGINWYEARSAEIRSVYMEQLFYGGMFATMNRETGFYELTESGEELVERQLEKHDKQEDSFITEIIEKIAQEEAAA